MAEPQTTTTEQPTGTVARLGQLAWQALPAIAGAISVLGFVTLVGGAIVWVRFFSAGLPADQAVRAMPRQELITIGAVSLVSFAVIGVIVVLALYLLDENGAASRKTFLGLTLLAVAEFVAILLGFTELGHSEWLLAAWFGLSAFLAYRGLKDATKGLEAEAERKADAEPLRAAWSEFLAATDRRDDAAYRKTLTPQGPPPHWPIEHHHRAAVASLHEQRDWTRALDRWTEALPKDSEARKAAKKLPRDKPPPERDLDDAIDVALDEAYSEAGLDGAREFFRARWPWLALTFAVLAPVIYYLFQLNHDDEVMVAAAAVLIAVLAAANFAVARITRGFAWYGVTALASLIVFGAGVNIVKTIREPQVQPVALVRKSDGATLCGVYVTETDKRLYIGRIQGRDGEDAVGADAKAGRMFWIPLDDVEVVSVGPIQDMEDARWRAPRLVREVLADRPDPPSAPVKNRQTTVTKDSSERRSGIVTTTTVVEQVAAKTTDAGGTAGGAQGAAEPSGIAAAADPICEGTDLRQSAEPPPPPKPSTPAARTTPGRPAP